MRTLLFSFFTFLIFSCQNEVENKKITSLNGFWQSLGSGQILEIRDSSIYIFYDINSLSCLPRHRGDFQEISKGLSLHNDTLSHLNGVINYQFVPLKDLPVLCSETIPSEQLNDPEFNFAVFAETLAEHYAFFDLNKLNADSLLSAQKAKVTAHTSPAELYLTMEETMEMINDNHAYLEAPDSVYAEVEKLNSESKVTDAESAPEYGDFQIADMVAKHYLSEEMTRDSWLIRWGLMGEGTAYVQIKSMWLYADLDIPAFLIDSLGYVDAYVHTFSRMYEGGYIQKEVAGVAKVMDKVMSDLGRTERIVLDVRFNGGGQDAVSFEILSRFIEGKLQIATQKLRYGNQFTDTQRLFIEGVSTPYKGQVYILTSPQTGSAAEAFSIASMAMKNTRRIGSATSGAMSTALEKTLPKGWSFALSNEIYMDNAGNCYENIGVPVDYELNYPRDRQEFFRSVAADLATDKEMTQKAIADLSNKKPKGK